jgi:predicted SnoaL-like aldol condensation-catalyzing enzyme
MSRSIRLSFAAVVAALVALPAGAQMRALSDPVVGHPDPESLFTSKDPKLNRNKQAALRIERELLQCNLWDRAGEWLTDKYIQHNLSAPDGLKGFQALVHAVPKGSARVNTVRVFQDGEYVFAHTDYNVFGPKIGFDVFRFEDGKIVEHWDTLQETPTSPNPSGRTMIDGPTQAVDLEKTAANRLVARAFVEDVLVNGRVDKIGEYYEGDIIQHHPQIPDTIPALIAVFGGWAKAGITVTHDRIHKVLGEGNFVLVLSEGHFAGKHTAFSDLFRIQNGKIAEHWNVVQEIPPRAEWKNENGKF